MTEAKSLVCLACGNSSFKKEEGKMDTKWGLMAHKVRLMICQECGFIMSFSKGKTLWDFD